jgi:hypothetical protein
LLHNRYFTLLTESLLLCLFCYLPLAAQKKNAEYQLPIRRASASLTIDGLMNEPDWAAAQVATDFFMVLPMDTSAAKVRTEVRMMYDARTVHGRVAKARLCFR